MSLLIKGMEMPTSEEKCKFFQPAPFRAPFCVINGVCHGIDDCPVTPVPDHGDLIDRDTIGKEFERICDQYDAGIISEMTCLNMLLVALHSADTIIPADKEDQE